jgi:hypothetical protein
VDQSNIKPRVGVYPSLLYNDSQEESSMSVNVMVQQDVVRQAVIEVARLPEQDLLRALAYVNDLKEIDVNPIA